MPPRVINIGRAFSCPLESNYNVYRRLLIANPSISKTLLERSAPIIKTLYPDIYKAVDNRIKQVILYAYSIQYPDINIDRFASRLTISPKCYRQCSACAKMLFHSPIYDYVWLTHCPIHNIPLELLCPECGIEWPSTQLLPRTQCATCGLGINQQDALKDGAFNSTAHKALNYLYEVLNTSNNCIDSENYVMSNGRALRNCVSPTSLFAPAIFENLQQRKIGSVYRRNLVVAKMKTHEFKLSPFDQNQITGKEIVDITFPWVRPIQISIIRKIAKAIRSLTGNTHFIDGGSGYSDCPYCIAFNYWWCLVTTVYSDSGLDSSYSQRTILSRPLFEVARPGPVTQYLSKDGVIYNLPTGAQKIIYEKDLEMSYYALFKFAVDCLNYPGGNHFQLRKSAIIPYPYLGKNVSNLSFDFWVLKKSRSRALLIYSDEPIICRENMAFVKAPKTKCMTLSGIKAAELKKYIDNVYFYEEQISAMSEPHRERTVNLGKKISDIQKGFYTPIISHARKVVDTENFDSTFYTG